MSPARRGQDTARPHGAKQVDEAEHALAPPAPLYDELLVGADDAERLAAETRWRLAVTRRV